MRRSAPGRVALIGHLSSSRACRWTLKRRTIDASSAPECSSDSCGLARKVIGATDRRLALEIASSRSDDRVRVGIPGRPSRPTVKMAGSSNRSVSPRPGAGRRLSPTSVLLTESGENRRIQAVSMLRTFRWTRQSARSQRVPQPLLWASRWPDLGWFSMVLWATGWSFDSP
jgi:hypothetical protein